MPKNKKVELEDWEHLSNKIENEGFDYCFDGYSNWEDIHDEEFQRLRSEYLKAKNALESYINNKISEEG